MVATCAAWRPIGGWIGDDRNIHEGEWSLCIYHYRIQLPLVPVGHSQIYNYNTGVYIAEVVCVLSTCSFSFNLFLFSTSCICFIATKIILKTEERGDKQGGSACGERNKEEKIRPSFPQLYMDLMVKY